MAEKKKRSKITTFHGYLIDAITGAKIRPATATEASALKRARKSHGGIVVLDGRAVKLGGIAAARKAVKKKAKKKARKRS